MLLFFRGERFQLHASAHRQVLQGFAKVPALFLHNKLKDITAFVAFPKAAPGARIGKDYKRRRSRVGMKWAETCIVATCTPQFHRFRYQINNIDASFNLICNRHARPYLNDINSSMKTPGKRYYRFAAQTSQGNQY